MLLVLQMLIQYPNFGVKITHFRPQRPIEALPVNVFNKNNLSHWSPDVRVPKVLLPLLKNVFFAQNCQFAKYWQFCQKKQCKQGAQVVFYYVGTKNFCFLPYKIRIFDQKTAKFGLTHAFLVLQGQILAYLIHLVPCPTNKTMPTRCLTGFLICVCQNFCSLTKQLGRLAQNVNCPEICFCWHIQALPAHLATLLSGWLVVAVHGLYLARQLFYCFHLFFTKQEQTVLESGQIAGDWTLQVII